MSDETPRERFSFLHAADVHLDSPLRGLERYEGAPVDAIRGATREALSNLVAAALERAVDFVVIAGDLFDGDRNDYNSALFFAAQMGRLDEARIPVFVVAGNHDAANRITRSLHPPRNVHLFAHRAPETRLHDRVAVAVHGQSFARHDVSEDLSRGYPLPIAGRFNVGVLHTAITGREGHAPYAPCSVQGLRDRGYDYWALGHVHRREEVSRDPWIVFPGNLQGRHARETGPKGATWVGVDAGAVTSLEHVPLDVVRWFDLDVALRGCARPDEVWPRVRECVEQAVADAAGRLAAVRLRLTGASAADAALRADPDAVTAQCRALAAGCAGEVWLEQVRIETRARADRARAAARDDALGGLLGAIRELHSDDAALQALADEFAELRARLPPEVLGDEDGADPTTPEALRAALADVPALLVRRLVGEDDAP